MYLFIWSMTVGHHSTLFNEKKYLTVTGSERVFTLPITFRLVRFFLVRIQLDWLSESIRSLVDTFNVVDLPNSQYQSFIGLGSYSSAKKTSIDGLTVQHDFTKFDPSTYMLYTIRIKLKSNTYLKWNSLSNKNNRRSN